MVLLDKHDEPNELREETDDAGESIVGGPATQGGRRKRRGTIASRLTYFYAPPISAGTSAVILVRMRGDASGSHRDNHGKSWTFAVSIAIE